MLRSCIRILCFPAELLGFDRGFEILVYSFHEKHI